MSEEIQNPSVFDLFEAASETIQEAVKKQADESNVRTSYLRFEKDGTYTVRILPLAPPIGADGKPLPMDRKGYEYPSQEQLLAIENPSTKKPVYVNVVNAKRAFPQLENDLIDLYVSTVCDIYADDQALCKKVRGSGFEGGLKYNRTRTMYVYNDKRELQLLQLSYSQYKMLDDAKVALWQKLIAKNPKAQCPISSIRDAYPVEFIRKTENGKVSYSVNIDTIADTDQLTKEELDALVKAPRLPEVLYTYNRRMLEGTIACLKQKDKQWGISIMDEPAIQDCIAAIKLCLPASDNSHFNLNGKGEEGSAAGKATIDDLYEIYDKITADGETDRSEAGNELRTKIREFIEDNNLDVEFGRKMSNLQALEACEAALNSGSTRQAEVDDDTDEEPEEVSERNDDTNEPAVRARRKRM